MKKLAIPITILVLVTILAAPYASSGTLDFYIGTSQIPKVTTSIPTKLVVLSTIEYSRVEITAKGLLPIKVCEVTYASNQVQITSIKPGSMYVTSSRETIALEVTYLWNKCTLSKGKLLIGK